MVKPRKVAEPLVEILLATYNGGQYISQQLDSLLAQTHKNLRVLVHDDGSLDNTVEIVDRYATRYKDKITLVLDGIRTGGPKNNFSHLMQLSTAQYIAFCDQDDIWAPDKVELSLSVCQQAESELSAGAPVGVFTDLTVVDSKLSVISESMWKMQGTEPSLAKSVRRLALRNCVTGCTLFMNRASVTMSLPIPAAATMHDWWIALVILRKGGGLCPVNVPTVLYRQHGGNAVGAKGNTLNAIIGKAMAPTLTFSGIVKSYNMAKELGIYNNLFSFIFNKFKELAFSSIRK